MARWGELIFNPHFYNLLFLLWHSFIKNTRDNDLLHMQAIQGFNEGLPGLRFFR
jgi:hypothetical protein